MIRRIVALILSYRVATALGAGGTAFTVFSTIFSLTGLSGGLKPLAAALYLSTFAAFGTFIVLQEKRHAHELRVASFASAAGQSGSRRPVGVVAPISFWATSYYVAIIKAIRDAADRERPDLRRKVVVLDVPYEELIDLDQTLADDIVRHVSGLILINMSVTGQTRNDLLTAHIPVVSVTHEDRRPPTICSVLPDHSGFEALLDDVIIASQSVAAVLVTKQLANPFKRGRVDRFRREKREIFEHACSSADLMGGGVASLADLSSPFQISPGFYYIFEVDKYCSDDGRVLFERTSTTLPPNTTMVFLADVVAIGFLIACTESGRSAADRMIRVTGFDNSEPARWFELSSVDYQLDTVGRIAYERLQMALDNPGSVGYTNEVVSTVPYLRRSSHW